MLKVAARLNSIYGVHHQIYGALNYTGNSISLGVF